MKKVLCYGDSNTWGYIPGSGGRFVYSLRWTGVLQISLGPEYRVFEEGLNGRTTGSEDPEESGRNGASSLAAIMEHYQPLDLIIIMLGTNDLKRHFDLSPSAIARNAGALISIAEDEAAGPDGSVPSVLLVSPPEVQVVPWVSEPMFSGASDKCKLLPIEYRRIAQQHECYFYNATNLVAGSGIDGVHLDKSGHQLLGLALADEVRSIVAEEAVFA